jgi:hypothetical protein
MKKTVKKSNDEYCVKEWSSKNGFDFISCDGDGYDGGYEPNFRRGWY